MGKLQYYGFSSHFIRSSFSISNNELIKKTSNQLCNYCTNNKIVSLSSNQLDGHQSIFTILKKDKLINKKWTNYQKLKPNCYMTYINPEIEDVSVNNCEDWQECASYPGLKIKIQRPQYIKVCFRNIKKLAGFIARVFQHEIDHLKGVDILQKATEISILDTQIQKKHGEIVYQKWQNYKNNKDTNSSESFHQFKKELVYRIIDSYRL